MAALVASFMLVILAEMGDKTQLLAMAFAAHYSVYKVLIAISLATLINHALAVAAGHFLSVAIPMEIISFLAALSFVIFGLWTIRGDRLEGEGKKGTRYGPILTVGIAFFLAEMGDKTQLATVSLAVKYQNVANVLAGTTLGMVAADALGIAAGAILMRRIPGQALKWISAGIFALFGFIGIYNILSVRLGMLRSALVLLVIGTASAWGAYYLARVNNNSHSSVG